MKGSIAFSAKSRTVRARCFLNASSNMTKLQKLLGEKWMLSQIDCEKMVNAPRHQANSSAPAGVNCTKVPDS
jgi:hypothetical protein